jgi:hypothetical protein
MNIFIMWKGSNVEEGEDKSGALTSVADLDNIATLKNFRSNKLILDLILDLILEGEHSSWNAMTIQRYSQSFED